jgi:hypothetical protein
MMRLAIEAESPFEQRQTDRAHYDGGSSARSIRQHDVGVPVSRAGSIAWAISALRDQGMPSEEIAAILEAADPRLVHRYLELHRERLAEHLVDQRRTVARLERLLAARSIASTARARDTEASGR